jgi:hypothetical protein
MICGSGPCPLALIPWHFASQLRKSTENLGQGSQLVLDTSRCVDLAAF